MASSIIKRGVGKPSKSLCVKPLSHGAKNAGQIQVKSRFDQDNTFHKCRSPTNTEAGQLMTRARFRWDCPVEGWTSATRGCCLQLSENQHEQMQNLLEEYHDVLCGIPGRAEHVIDMGDSHPIHLHSCRVPHAYWDEVECQVTEKLEKGVILAAPIVLVQKKDGTLCFCVD